MNIVNFIRMVTVLIFLLYVLTVDKIVKCLDKPFFLILMRTLCVSMFAVFLFFSCIGFLNIFGYAGKLLQTQVLKMSELLKLIPDCCVITITLFYWKYFWYYIRNDNDTILSGWYIKKSFDLNRQREFEQSYHCLQKASEIEPDSVHIWCILASFSQLFLKDPEQANIYLAKARKILDYKSSKNPKEIAAFEYYSGLVLQNRNDHKTALEHMKKAYELDPTRYRKEQYEEALELLRKEKNSASKESE